MLFCLLRCIAHSLVAVRAHGIGTISPPTSAELGPKSLAGMWHISPNFAKVGRCRVKAGPTLTMLGHISPKFGPHSAGFTGWLSFTQLGLALVVIGAVGPQRAKFGQTWSTFGRICVQIQGREHITRHRDSAAMAQAVLSTARARARCAPRLPLRPDRTRSSPEGKPRLHCKRAVASSSSSLLVLGGEAVVEEAQGPPNVDASTTECLRDRVPDQLPIFDISDLCSQSSLDERIKVGGSKESLGHLSQPATGPQNPHPQDSVNFGSMFAELGPEYMPSSAQHWSALGQTGPNLVKLGPDRTRPSSPILV